MSNEKNFMTNPARPLEDGVGEISAEEKYSDCCDDPLLFHMRDNYHEFYMGLFPILHCLKFAEQEGYVPPLGDDWWISICSRYHVRL